jgi:hypothetical protein
LNCSQGPCFGTLHNFANFDGLELIPGEDAVVMTWSVPSKPNPWGCRENHFKAMELVFKDLLFLHVGPRDEELPITEDGCVARILKVDPDISGEPYMREIRHPDDSFRLAFQFQSQRVIEIESVVADLVPKNSI